MAEASEGVVMGETVAEIRESYYEGGFTSEARPGRERIGTLLAEIDRQDARLKLAEAVCEAYGRYAGAEAWDAMWTAHKELQTLLPAYLAGKGNNDGR